MSEHICCARSMHPVEILADMAGRHAAHDVYDLWIEQRDDCILLGWDTYNGERRTFWIGPDGDAQPVGRPADRAAPDEAVARAESPAGRLRAWQEWREGDAPFCIVCEGPDEKTRVLREPGVSFLFPAVCFDREGGAWLAWIRCGDVENADGVVDQFNEIVCARFEHGEWASEVVADLRYGLQPKAGVWGYPGKRRRPWLAPDDRGGVWVLWERKEPHDAATTRVSGVLCGRRGTDAGWAEPVRLVEGGYFDYAPAARGVQDAALVVAAQKAGRGPNLLGRGEVTALRVRTDAARPLEPDAGFEQWKTVNLLERRYFEPATREMEWNGRSYRLLFGDPHTHTAFSEDAEGDLVEMLAYARDKAKLDFVAITDNDYIYGGRLSDRDWKETMEREQEWSEDGRFLAVPGYEWTLPSWGPVRPQHRSILFASYDQPILRWSDVEGDPMDALVAWIQTTDGVMNTQHPQFQLTRSDREANLEVCSGWGDYINKSGCFHDHLNRGFKAGFIAASDGHRRTPGLGGGLTGLWVEEFTLAGVIDAFRRRRCYATAGARVGLRFWVNDAFMGETLRDGGPLAARVAVDAPREVERLDIFGDGEIVASRTGLPRSFDIEIPDLPRCAWYYARVTMPGGFPEYPSNLAPAAGPWAWSSPVFAEE